MFCYYCDRPLCEDFITRTLTTGDSDEHCEASPDGKHHLEGI